MVSKLKNLIFRKKKIKYWKFHLSLFDILRINKFLLKVYFSHYVVGSEITLLEKEICSYVGCKYAVALTNNTAGIYASLMAIGIKPGDEIIISPYTFISDIHSIKATGAIPIYVDIDRESLNINASSIESKITSKTKAILSVDIFGNPCNFKTITQIVKKYHLKLICDAAHSLGAEYDHKKIGNIGDMTCLSFNWSKNISGFSGGMITTNNKKYYLFLKRIINHGLVDGDRKVEGFGWNFKFNDFQASLIRSQLKQINHLVRKRAEIGNLYRQRIDSRYVDFQKIEPNSKNVFNRFILILKKSQNVTGLKEYLRLHNIECGYALFESIDFVSKQIKAKSAFGNFLRLKKRIVVLPMNSHLTKHEAKYVANTVNSFFKDHP